MGKTCAVLDCAPTTSNVSLYKLPNSGKTKASWLKFLSLVNSKWMWQPVNVMHVCQHHFEQRFIITAPSGTTRVRDNGYPSVMNGICLPEMTNEDLVYEVSDKAIVITDIDKEENKMLKLQVAEKDSIIQDLKEKLQQQQQRLDENRAKLKSANQLVRRREAKRKLDEDREDDDQLKRAKISDESFLEALEEKISSTELREVVKRAVLNNKKAPYSDTLKEFAYRLHYYCGKGYEMLRDKFHKCLPTTRSFNTWTQHVKSTPGFLPNALTYLKEMNAISPYKLYYALSVDEIHIRRQIIHKDDGFVGYIDYGGICDVQNEDREKVANAALFVYATCINGTHKVPICYILTNGLKSDVLSAVIRESLIQLNMTNSIVLSITFDGLPSNFTAMEKLGAHLNVKKSNFKPYIRNPETQLDVAVIADVCHMYKLFRNLFKKYGVLKNYRGETIKWVYIHRLQQLQDREGLKAANKLSKRHIAFELNSMKTKLCLQVMSNSVAVGLALCRLLGIQGFEDCSATEEFLLLMNKLFDVLNSKRGGYGDKAPLRSDMLEEIIPFFAMIKFYLLTLTVNEKGQEKLLIKSKKFTAVKGLLITINSIEKIMHDVVGQDNHDLIYLPTYKQSQDKIELFFGTIRSRFGSNNNPNIVQLSQAVKGILCMKAKCIVEGNCEDQENDEGTRACAFRNLNTILDEREGVNYEYMDDDDYSTLPELSKFSGNVIAYISGSIGHKLATKCLCANCILNLTASEDDWKNIDEYTLIDLKNNGGLFYPSIFLLSVCKIADQVSRAQPSLKNISKDQLVRIIQKRSNAYGDSWRGGNSADKCNHFAEMVEKIAREFLKIKLHHVGCEASMANIPTTSRNHHNRMVILEGS